MKKTLADRRVIYRGGTIWFKDLFLQAAQTRSDDVAKAVIAHIGYEIDLFADEAGYHFESDITFSNLL